MITVVPVKAWLEGRPGDLEVAARHFAAGDPTVGCDDDGTYYLTSPAFDDLWDGGGLPEAASALLTQVNGLARVLDPSYRPIRLGTRFSDDTGRGHMVALAGAVEVSAALGIAAISINGVPQEPPPSPAPDFMRQVAEHPDVGEALRILGIAGENASWHDLYKVFEIVRDNVGGNQALIARGWKSKQDISAFTVSANSPHVSGDGARHARLSEGVPQYTMSLADGRAFISQLVLGWLNELSRSR